METGLWERGHTRRFDKLGKLMRAGRTGEEGFPASVGWFDMVMGIEPRKLETVRRGFAASTRGKNLPRCTHRDTVAHMIPPNACLSEEVKWAL